LLNKASEKVFGTLQKMIPGDDVTEVSVEISDAAAQMHASPPDTTASIQGQ
jgi:hypothetical protein